MTASANSTSAWCPVFSCSFWLLCTPSANNKAQQLWNFIFQLRWSCYLRYRGAMIKTASISHFLPRSFPHINSDTMCYISECQTLLCAGKKKKKKQKTMTSAVQLIFTSQAEASSNLHFQTPAARCLGNVGTFTFFKAPLELNLPSLSS